MDLFDKCVQFTDAKRAMAEGYYPYFIPLEQTDGTEVVINGRRLIMIGSNNYLGLATHPRVRQAAIDAVKCYGTSCTGSRFLNGTLMLHKDLERKLAQFVRKEAALVFSTGFQTNLGAISALVGKGDVVILDHDDHASIVDGCRLAQGETKRFPHNDMGGLEKILRSCDPDVGKLVIVDGVFSMGGDIAPLPDIIALCKKYGARLMVDDAHSIGVLGEEGRGTSSHFGVEEDVDLIMGTFSKSFASLGGFIAGPEPVIHYIQHFARSLIFSASMPPPCLASALASLEVMQTEPEWQMKVLANAEKMRRGFQEMGFDTGASQTPVIPIIIGDMMNTFAMWKELFAAGVYVNPVVPPAVPPKMSLLRTSYMATHTETQLDLVLAAFAEVGEKMGMAAFDESG
jgi:8-amino-7-oxononanoate synthase